MGIRKRGELRYEIIGSLILGLLVVAIVSAWLFNGYFSEDDINWEVCRETLILRNSLPEKDVVAGVISAKSWIPLKCETRVIDIDYENTTRIEKKIGETISSCWYMIGQGNYKVFPGKKALNKLDTPCMMCARIHLNSDVEEFYSEEENRINLERAVNTRLEGYDATVWEYLNTYGDVSAFPYFGGWNETNFNIKFQRDSPFDRGFNPREEEIFFLPKYFYPENGDLFIGYSEPTKEISWGEERVIDPYMFFLQYEDFDKLNYNWALSQDFSNDLLNGLLNPWEVFTRQCEDCAKVCSSIETVPA